jgi:aspartate/methionine/tyrosine aminotransferase
MVADAALARRVWRLNDLYGNVQPFAMDWLSARAFDHLPALLARAQALLVANRRVFGEWAAARRDIDVAQTTWGTTACLRPATVPAGRFCDKLRTGYDVSVVPGEFFESPQHVRVSLCTETPVLIEGLARIGRCLEGR